MVVETQQHPLSMYFFVPPSGLASLGLLQIPISTAASQWVGQPRPPIGTHFHSSLPVGWLAQASYRYPFPLQLPSGLASLGLLQVPISTAVSQWVGQPRPPIGTHFHCSLHFLSCTCGTFVQLAYALVVAISYLLQQHFVIATCHSCFSYFH